MNGNQVLGYLARNDKWFLGGGRMALWAPEFPLWLDHFGFWDHACYLDYRVGPVFTVAIIDERGREVTPQLIERFWQPDHTSQLYRDKARGLVISERRAMLPLDVLCSTFEFANSLKQSQSFEVVIWSSQERFQSNGIYEIEGCRAREHDGTLVWRRRVREAQTPFNPEKPDEGVMMRFAVALGASKRATSFGVKTSDRQPNYPHWKYSPFYEKLAEYGHLGNQVPAVIDPNFGGLTYFGLHYKLTVPAEGRLQFSAFAAIAPNEEEALVNLLASRRSESFNRSSRPDSGEEGGATQSPDESPSREKRPTLPAKRHWREYFESVPDFTCSDPYLQKYYWYRWYGMRLNTVRAKDPRLGLPYPCVFEGINLGWFRQHITYSAQCHMYEARWMLDPALAQGSLLNFVANQLEDGSFPGVIKNIYQGDRSLRIGVAFYHTNWGRAVRELHRIHPDRAFLEKIYQPLVRYLLYFDRVRDPDQTGLYDVINQQETGQEFNGRYMEVNPQADKDEALRLKGVDATVYIYQLQETVAWIAEELNYYDEAGRWWAMHKKTGQAILEHMWDQEKEFFFDVNPANMQRTTTKAATGFYPFMVPGLATREHLGVFQRHLFNPKEFWTPYPVPATSMDEPTFSPDGEWKDQRLVCPWNGRTWLMTNSHVTEALCRAALEIDPSLQPKAVELLNTYIRMLFLEGDQDRPSSYEYYNPITGQAPYFRGTEDYMHSWIVDLIIKYVAGLQPGDGGQVRVNPLPFDLDFFTLDRVRVAGHSLKISWRKSAAVEQSGQSTQNPVGLTVWVDGVIAGQSPTLGPLDLKL